MENAPGSGSAAAQRLLDALTADTTQSNLSEAERDEILDQLKVLGRDVNNVRSSYNATGIGILGHYGFGDYPTTTAREARRCIANALLLLPQTQKYFVELGLAPKAVHELRSQNNDDEFLLSRILFLLTYNNATDIDTLVIDHDLAKHVISHIGRHARDGTASDGGSTEQPNAVAALSETLKLLSNVTIAKPEYINQFSNATPDIIKILANMEIPSPPLQPPLIYVLNALANLDLQLHNENTAMKAQPSTDVVKQALNKLIIILDQAVQAYKPAQLNTQAIPLLTVLRQVNAGSDNSVKEKMKAELLPKDSERDVPLGHSSTLASRLLKLTVSPGLTRLPEAISSLLFELSDKDASTFVKNVGYGYAAGYLMSHQISVPESVRKAQGDPGQVPVNPITGQRLDKEPDVSMPNMTQEEKEREAERLFVLFERLRATGVVDVKNPVQMARDEGRFEELNDSDAG